MLRAATGREAFPDPGVGRAGGVAEHEQGGPQTYARSPRLAFSGAAGPVPIGVLIWGAATGLQDSTVKALVAQLVPAGRRATGYGMFAAVQGIAAVAGLALTGGLSARSVPALVADVAVPTARSGAGRGWP